MSTTEAFALALTPQATTQNQILLSQAGPDYAWGLALNPAAAASVPPASAARQLLMSDASPSWQITDPGVVFALGLDLVAIDSGTF